MDTLGFMRTLEASIDAKVPQSVISEACKYRVMRCKKTSKRGVWLIDPQSVERHKTNIPRLKRLIATGKENERRGIENGHRHDSV